MSIITFTSDFGTSDHYAAAVKAALLSENLQLQLLDITHDIASFNIIHGAYVLKSVFRDFPQGTIHIVAIDSLGTKTNRHLVVKLEEHFFIGPDNGILTLLSEQKPSLIVSLSLPDSQQVYSFPAKHIYAKAAARLAEGESPASLGEYVEAPAELLPRRLKANRRLIVGHVEHVDHYGNLITNINRQIFEELVAENDFTIQFGREKVDMITENLNSVEYGEVFLLFNSLGRLEIGVNKGIASDLLGLGFDAPVRIVIHEKKEKEFQ